MFTNCVRAENTGTTKGVMHRAHRNKFLICIILLTFVLLFTFMLVQAQSPVITADNVTALQSVQTIDFDTEEVNSGWFALSPDGQYIAVPHTRGGLIIWDNQGELIDATTATTESGEMATLLDADFSLDGTEVAAVYTDGTDYWIDIHMLKGETQTLDYDIEYGESGLKPRRNSISKPVTALSGCRYQRTAKSKCCLPVPNMIARHMSVSGASPRRML
jgi:hypothetical protein